MTLHDAETKGYLKEFGRVIIRVFDIGNESPESFHNEANLFSSPEEKDKNKSDHPDDYIDKTTTLDNNSLLSVKQNSPLSHSISKIICSLDEKKLKKKKKAKSSTTEKVRKMLIRGKAKGSKSIKEEDRFYLEAILIDEEGEDINLSSVQIVYLSKNASAEKIISCTSWPSDTENKNIEILISDKVTIEATDTSIQYFHLPSDIILNDDPDKNVIVYSNR